MGLLALAAPAGLASLVGLTAGGRDGRSEIRGVYGGFGVAMALMTAVALTTPTLRTGIAFTLGAALLGMAAGRCISLAVDRGLGPFLWGVLAGEIVAGGLLLGVATGRIASLGLLP